MVNKILTYIGNIITFPFCLLGASIFLGIMYIFLGTTDEDWEKATSEEEII